MNVYASPKEWYLCLQTGFRIIRSPHEANGFPLAGYPQLTVWHLPSFVDCKSWSVLRDQKTGTLQIVTTVWKQEEDSQRMDPMMRGEVDKVSPEPTIEFILANLNEQWFSKQYKNLSRIRPPLVVKDKPIGLDGESFGVSLPVFKVSFEWWGNGPKEWKKLAEWTKKFINEVEKNIVFI